jgi:hypothetical protein
MDPRQKQPPEHVPGDHHDDAQQGRQRIVQQDEQRDRGAADQEEDRTYSPPASGKRTASSE